MSATKLFIGTSEVSTSTANLDIASGVDRFEEIDFYNVDACTVKINGSDAIYLRAGQGFIDESPIYKFIIVEESIDYNYIASYIPS